MLGCLICAASLWHGYYCYLQFTEAERTRWVLKASRERAQIHVQVPRLHHWGTAATFFSSWRSPLSPASNRTGEELVMNNVPDKQHWRQDILDILEILHTFLFFVLSACTECMPHKRENSSARLRSSQLVAKDGLFFLHHVVGLCSSAFALGLFVFNPVLSVTVR